MKVRIIGTSTQKYLDNFYKIHKKDESFLLMKEGLNFCIASSKNYELLLKFRTNVTRRQNIEVWEGLGLVRFDNNEVILNYEEEENIYAHMKKHLIQYSSKSYIQKFRNMKLLVIEYLAGSLNKKLVEKMNIQQTRGNFDISKIKKEISSVEKKMSKDPAFLLQVRKVLYNYVS